MDKFKKAIKYIRNIVWLKLGLDIFTSLVIIYLIVQFFLNETLSAPEWMLDLYKIVLSTFVFSHEAFRWIMGHGRQKHYSWYFDHGEIYVVAWILAALFLWIMEGIFHYPEPSMVIKLTIWSVGAYAASRISKESHKALQKRKDKPTDQE
jgi:hypothetical protein